MIDWCVIGLYYIVAILYIQLSNSKKIYSVVLILLVPFVGILLNIAVDYYSNKYLNAAKVSIEEDMTMDFFTVQEINIQKEVDVIPMDEALSLNELNIRRQAVMNTLLSDNLEEYLAVLKKALENEDTETSHYATTVILEMQNKVMDTLMKQEVAYRSNPNDEEIIYLWNNSLLKVLNSGLFNERNVLKYSHAYVELSNILLQNPDVAEHYLLERIQYDFNKKDYTHALPLCMRYKELYPSSEDMVLCFIQYYVDIKDKEGLDMFFKEIKSLPVILSQRSLQFVRFFS